MIRQVVPREHRDATQLRNPRGLLPYLSGRAERLQTAVTGTVHHPYVTAGTAASPGQGQNSAEHYRKTKLEVEIS